MIAPTPGEAVYYSTILHGENNLSPLSRFRYMRMICTVTGPSQPTTFKMQYFNEPGITKTFDNTINKALGWLKRWKR